LLLWSCGTHTDQNDQTAIQGKETIKIDKLTETRHCYIKKIFSENDRTYIKVDYIEFLTGEKAIEIAKEDGQAEFNISEFGDTIYYVLNDYYIINKNNKLRTFELSSDIVIELFYYTETNYEIQHLKNTDLKKLEEHIKNHPILVIEIIVGIVRSLKEQYTP
jgi:hypothetical protein